MIRTSTRKLILGISLSCALVGAFQLIEPNGGREPCSGPGCLARSVWAAKGQDAKSDLGKVNDAKSDLGKGNEAKSDLAKGTEASATGDLAKGDDGKSDLGKDGCGKTDLGGRF